MMKYCLTLPFLLLLFNVNAQIIDSSKYFITKALINNEDLSTDYSSNKQYLSFYKNEQNELCFLNSRFNKEEYSYGRINHYRLLKSKIDSFNVDEISFRWNFRNSYDIDTGYAVVQLTKLYKNNQPEFSFKMVSPSDIIEFSGYVK